MCELFAMSALKPATVNFSLEEFARHGGLSGPHKDGWGIAYLQDRDARVIREPRPAASSACVQFIQNYPIGSSLVVSHVRLATQGKVSLENTQPYTRELGGTLHVFAHNGDLDLANAAAFDPGRFRPIGDTDSEFAFCALLTRLEALWLAGDQPPSVAARREVVVDFARDLRGRGIANFIYTDGELIFAHGHKRHQRDGSIEPPGLHFLCRRCRDEPSSAFITEGLAISSDQSDQAVVLVASVPLTDEGWLPLEAGEVLTIAEGEVVSRDPVEG